MMELLGDKIKGVSEADPDCEPCKKMFGENYISSISGNVYYAQILIDWLYRQNMHIVHAKDGIYIVKHRRFFWKPLSTKTLAEADFQKMAEIKRVKVSEKHMKIRASGTGRDGKRIDLVVHKVHTERGLDFINKINPKLADKRAEVEGLGRLYTDIKKEIEQIFSNQALEKAGFTKEKEAFTKEKAEFTKKYEEVVAENTKQKEEIGKLKDMVSLLTAEKDAKR